MKRLAIILIILTVLGAAGGVFAVERHNSSSQTPAQSTQSLNSSDALNPANVINLVNKQREGAGLLALHTSPELMKSASEKCAEMVKDNYYGHDDPITGKHGYQYIQEAIGSNYYAAENLAQTATQSASDPVNGWMHSPEHKAVILDGKYSLTGVAICQPSNPLAYAMVVEHFAGSPIQSQVQAQPQTVIEQSQPALPKFCNTQYYPRYFSNPASAQTTCY